MDYELPILIQTRWIFGVFIFAIVAFHLVLVCWMKLGEKAWKRVDYIWLVVGALGILSALEKPRETLAKNLQQVAEERLVFTYSQVRSALTGELRLRASPSIEPTHNGVLPLWKRLISKVRRKMVT
ncbi:MAG: hypothetical protein ABIH23_21795 [bacterium]